MPGKQPSSFGLRNPASSDPSYERDPEYQQRGDDTEDRQQAERRQAAAQ
jgi:hypothetical protein